MKRFIAPLLLVGSILLLPVSFGLTQGEDPVPRTDTKRYTDLYSDVRGMGECWCWMMDSFAFSFYLFSYHLSINLSPFMIPSLPFRFLFDIDSDIACPWSHNVAYMANNFAYSWAYLKQIAREAHETGKNVTGYQAHAGGVGTQYAVCRLCPPKMKTTTCAPLW